MTDAYVAGLVDGEGCISISHDRRKKKSWFYPRVDVGMTLRAKLDSLACLYGGTVRKTRDATDKWEEAWAWAVMTRKASAFLEKILPLLHIKTEQARLALLVQKTADLLPRRPNGGAAWNEEARNKCAALQIMIQELNQKGPLTPPEPGWFARVVGDYALTPQADMFSDLGFTEYSETFPDSGWFADGFLYELRTSEPPTCESGSLLWPTADASPNRGSNARYLDGDNRTGRMLKQEAINWPTARQEDGESCGNHPGAMDSRNWPTIRSHEVGDYQNQTDGTTQPTLTGMATLWQTPATDSFRSRGGDRKDEPGLDQQARMFPTPGSRDYRTPNKRSYQERSDTSKGEQLLPASLPAPPIPDGPQFSESAPTSRPLWPTPTDSMASLEKRRLNPRFVEWLMGFPISWTEL
jgi:hypothetical protein